MNGNGTRARPMAEETSAPSVADLMTTPVVAVDETETVDLANAEMKWAHIRHLPVVEGAGRFVGLLTQADLRVALTQYGRAATLPVAVVMRHPVFTIEPHAPLADAVELMLDTKLTALPVVDRAGQLVGILTESDFVRYVFRELTGRTFLTAVASQEHVTLRPLASILDDSPETGERVRS